VHDQANAFVTVVPDTSASLADSADEADGNNDPPALPRKREGTIPVLSALAAEYLRRRGGTEASEALSNGLKATMYRVASNESL